MLKKQSDEFLQNPKINNPVSPINSLTKINYLNTNTIQIERSKSPIVIKNNDKEEEEIGIILIESDDDDSDEKTQSTDRP